MITDWITTTTASFRIRPAISASRRTGETRKRRGHAPVDVLDQRHPAPRRAEHRGHHDHAGREERDVRVTVEAGDLDHPLEQRAEQQQPDHRLDQRHRDEPRLAPQLAQVAQRHVQGVPDQGHRVASASASAASNVRPVYLR
jgi:hypothetical protein